MKPTAPRTVLFIVIFGCIHVDRFTNGDQTGTTATTASTATSSEMVTSTSQKVSTTTPMVATSASSTLSSTSPTTTTAPTTATSVTSPITSNVVSATTSFSPREPSGPGWWLLVALVITIAIVIVAGVLFYRRQFSPYRRFLQNWRSNDDDTDNIVLQLEQPAMSNDQWPTRINFN